jgi:eukaryotic-like serine/threonine-protein kinase
LVEMNERGAVVRCRLAPLDGSSAGQQIGPPDGQCTFAAWSPDGTWMYFSSDSGGAFHTWRQRFPDGQPEQITSGPTEEEGLAMAPDGRSFITAVGLTQSSVWVHDGGGDRQVSLEGYALAPKFTPDGKRLLYQVRKGAASELWVAELDSGRSEPLLSGIAVALSGGGSADPPRGYDISPDGRQVVVASPDNGGKFRLWLAPLDRRSPPRQIPNVEGALPVFGATGEVFFHRVEGTSAFLYRVREDGSGLRKAFDPSIVGIMGESPDRTWLALGAGGLVIFRVDGGAPLQTRIAGRTLLRWSGDGKHVFVQSLPTSRDKTYVVPVTPGRPLPESFIDGLPSEQEIVKLPGVRVVASTDVMPGRTADTYAFTRESVQRNLYRIPVP